MKRSLNLPGFSQKNLHQGMQKNKVCHNAFMELPRTLYGAQFKPSFKIRDIY
jgi:hypothetical protein